MMLLSFAALVVFALRVGGSRKTAGLEATVQSFDMTELFADANKSENQLFDDATAQRHEELGLTPISSHSRFESRSRHNSREAMGEISSSDVDGLLKQFISTFKSSCSENSDALFHMDDRPETDFKVAKAVPITYWDRPYMLDKYIKTTGISGCNGDASNGRVCHVVFKLDIAVATAEPLAGLIAQSSKTDAYYMVCQGGRQFYGYTQWRWVETCHLVPESVLKGDDGPFEQVSDDRMAMTGWSCNVPGMASEMQESTPVAMKPSVQETEEKVQQYMKIEQQNLSSKEKCCCAQVRGTMRAFGVRLTGILGGSAVPLAVGHSGWWSGTPGHASCPVIGGLETGGKPCACTVHHMRWKAHNTCKPVPPHESAASYSPGGRMGEECVRLCNTPEVRSSISQECEDEAAHEEIVMANVDPFADMDALISDIKDSMPLN